MNETRYTLRPDEVLEHGRLPNIHPGEILRNEFLEPFDMTVDQLANGLGVAPADVEAILQGTRGITADTALRLSRFFGTSARLWMGLQTAYDPEEAEETLRAALEKIQPRAPAAV